MKHKPRLATGKSLGGPKIRWDGNLRKSPGWGKLCEPGWWSLWYGAHLSALWGNSSENEQWPLPGLLSGKELYLTNTPPAPAPRLLLWCQLLQFLPPLMPLVPFKLLPHAGAEREWVQVNLCMGPLRGIAWDSRSFCFRQPQSLLVFTAKS